MRASMDAPTRHSGQRAALIRNLAGLKKIPGSPLARRPGMTAGHRGWIASSLTFLAMTEGCRTLFSHRHARFDGRPDTSFRTTRFWRVDPESRGIGKDSGFAAGAAPRNDGGASRLDCFVASLLAMTEGCRTLFPHRHACFDGRPDTSFRTARSADPESRRIEKDSGFAAGAAPRNDGGASRLDCFVAEPVLGRRWRRPRVRLVMTRRTPRSHPIVLRASMDAPTRHSGQRAALIRNLAGLKKIPGSPLRGVPE
jgi:hypothetical protein